jgi:hypothetical protein
VVLHVVMDSLAYFLIIAPPPVILILIPSEEYMTENQLTRLTEPKLGFKLAGEQQRFYDNNDMLLCSSLKEIEFAFMLEGEE